MKFRVLGPIEILGDDGLIEVPGRRRRAVLARLLIAQGVPLDVNRLIDDAWDGAAPPGAPSTVKSHLSYLRGRLGRERIRETAGTVLLVLGTGELDAACFERELRQSRAALGHGEPAIALRLVDGALARFRGDPLSDVADSQWSRPERTRLHEMRTQAQELAIDARLALGQTSEAVTLAERLLHEHPYREHVAGQLMLALYRGGRQAEALGVFDRVRRRLDLELGLVPGRELAALEQAMLLHEPSLDLTSASASTGMRAPVRQVPGPTLRPILFSDRDPGRSSDPSQRRPAS